MTIGAAEDGRFIQEPAVFFILRFVNLLIGIDEYSSVAEIVPSIPKSARYKFISFILILAVTNSGVLSGVLTNNLI